MAEMTDYEKAMEQAKENGRWQSSNHNDVLKTSDGRESLMIDKDGFVKEIGKGSWRRYDPDEDRPND